MDSRPSGEEQGMSRWYVVAPERKDLGRHCYVRAEVASFPDACYILGSVTQEVGRKSIGEELFTPEMLAAADLEHRRALDAWRAGDDSEHADDVAKALLTEAASHVADLVSLANDETDPGELVHHHAESSEACRKLLELREVAAAAERIVSDVWAKEDAS
jgi:hypothetical protein